MLVASDQAPSTFLDFAVFPLSRQKFSNLGQHDVGHKGVTTGCRVLSLCSFAERAFALFLINKERRDVISCFLVND